MELIHIHQTKPRSRFSCWSDAATLPLPSAAEAPPTSPHPEIHWLEWKVGGADRTVDESKTHQNGFCVCSCSCNHFDSVFFLKKVGCGQNIKRFCSQTPYVHKYGLWKTRRVMWSNVEEKLRFFSICTGFMQETQYLLLQSNNIISFLFICKLC